MRGRVWRGDRAGRERSYGLCDEERRGANADKRFAKRGYRLPNRRPDAACPLLAQDGTAGLAHLEHLTDKDSARNLAPSYDGVR